MENETMISAPQLRYLIYFVTSRCNLRCSHCFYLDELGPSDELSLEEIERFCNSLKTLTFLRLTGGEPFLRKDLAEVMRLFYQITGTRRMGVITNGTRAAQVDSVLQQLARHTPNLKLDVGVSIDDIGEEHDAIRRKKGVYDSAIEQIRQLQLFQKGWSNLEVSVVVTANGKNTARLREIYDFLHGLGINRISCNLIRGYVADQELTQIDLGRYFDFLTWTDGHNRRHHPGLSAIIRRAKNRIGRKVIHNIIKARDLHRPLSKSRPFGGTAAPASAASLSEGDGYYALGKSAPLHCQAGNAIAVLQPEGDVNLCEVMDWPLGNLRESNFDWKSIWEGEKASKAREMILKTGCSCTHECFLTASILFNPRMYPELALESAKELLDTLRQH